MLVLLCFIVVAILATSSTPHGNYVNHNIHVESNQISHYNRQLVPTNNGGFREVDDLDRIEVLQFTLETLIKTATENELLKRRQGNKLAYNDKLFNDDDRDSIGGDYQSDLQQFFEKMSTSSFKVRNLTIVIALVYMDKVAQILHLYANGKTVRRLFGGCLIIASKMHRNEVDREELAKCMDLSVRDLVNIESSIVLSLKDLTVHPHVLLNYLTPLMGSKSPQNVYSQSERSQYNYYQ
jgi:Cyclin, N-terminal domain